MSTSLFLIGKAVVAKLAPGHEPLFEAAWDEYQNSEMPLDEAQTDDVFTGFGEGTEIDILVTVIIPILVSLGTDVLKLGAKEIAERIKTYWKTTGKAELPVERIREISEVITEVTKEEE